MSIHTSYIHQDSPAPADTRQVSVTSQHIPARPRPCQGVKPGTLLTSWPPPPLPSSAPCSLHGCCTMQNISLSLLTCLQPPSVDSRPSKAGFFKEHGKSADHRKVYSTMIQLKVFSPATASFYINATERPDFLPFSLLYFT